MAGMGGDSRACGCHDTMCMARFAMCGIQSVSSVTKSQKNEIEAGQCPGILGVPAVAINWRACMCPGASRAGSFPFVWLWLPPLGSLYWRGLERWVVAYCIVHVPLYEYYYYFFSTSSVLHFFSINTQIGKSPAVLFTKEKKYLCCISRLLATNSFGASLCVHCTYIFLANCTCVCTYIG